MSSFNPGQCIDDLEGLPGAKVVCLITECWIIHQIVIVAKRDLRVVIVLGQPLETERCNSVFSEMRRETGIPLTVETELKMIEQR